MSIQPADPTEKSTRLRQLVKQLAGQRLPGERELASHLAISRSSLRMLLTDLEAEGLVRRQQGSGTYAVDLHAIWLGTVVLLIDEELKLGDDPFFSQLVECLQSHLQAEGIRCRIERVNNGWEFHDLKDGVITIGEAGKAVLAQLPDNAPPIVGLLLDTKLPTTAPVSLFQLADHAAGIEVAQRLLDLQCRRVLFVGRRDIAATSERLRGAEEAVADVRAQLQFISCPLNYTAGLRLGRELELRDSDGPVGIIASNDWLALGLRAGLSSRQIDHPHIVSFDGLPITADPLLHIESLMVPLDTIAVDAIAELRRLYLPPTFPGRVVRYSFLWRP